MLKRFLQRRPPLNVQNAEWSIGIVRAQTLQQLPSAVPTQILTARDVRDCHAAFVADPFLLRRGDLWHLFFEVFSRDENRGMIGHATSADTDVWQYQGIVLKEPIHLSYPFVFEYDGQIFLMPETRKARQVRLYRAEEFPSRWVFERTLLRGRIADASIVKLGERWWLFAAQGPYSMALFYADSPRGPWHRHRQGLLNVRNKRCARPGGRPVVENGHIVRFAQDTTKFYGHQLRAYKVDVLSPWRYREHELCRGPFLSPQGTGWYGAAVHHVDPHRLPDGSWLAVIDGMGAR